MRVESERPDVDVDVPEWSSKVQESSDEREMPAGPPDSTVARNAAHTGKLSNFLSFPG